MWEVRTFAPAFGNEAGAAAEAAHLPLRGGNARGRVPVRRFEKKKLRKNLPVRKIRRNFAELFRRGFPEGFPATRKREHIDSFAITKTK